MCVRERERVREREKEKERDCVCALENKTLNRRGKPDRPTDRQTDRKWFAHVV